MPPARGHAVGCSYPESPPAGAPKHTLGLGLINALRRNEAFGHVLALELPQLSM